MFLFSSCAGIISLRNPKHAKGEGPGEKPPLEQPVLFEDFETGKVEGSYSYANDAGAASARFLRQQPKIKNPEISPQKPRLIRVYRLNGDAALV